MFWKPKSFDELAAEQGIYPLEDWDALGGNWPEGADFDSFLEAIRRDEEKSSLLIQADLLKDQTDTALREAMLLIQEEMKRREMF